ncbi:hypothetical protein ASPWEDRAFT_40440 [Aspergillus wentii DTO 134E9]|uniref:Uncharacterized protein n=1 Tax=Aspergillus wentii DTO 134E9 TaxID=1073089 RepID=A0A1L9RK25_ASPWE|nr:uncharacterized protein ASPWEDRAFT_40440 [Aspergillus wentii DTO 134E9]OJJ35253.1 hypothetical protein ASPWEDRAFT_40440 [Aspergillus wentii DTO 134E9]
MSPFPRFHLPPFPFIFGAHPCWCSGHRPGQLVMEGQKQEADVAAVTLCVTIDVMYLEWTLGLTIYIKIQI